MMKKERSAPHPVVSQYVWLMRILGAIYAVGALLFFFFPVEVFYVMNLGARLLSSLGVTEIPTSTESFWRALATSMMAMLATMSFLAAGSPGNGGYPFIQVVGKVISTIGFSVMFMTQGRGFPYLGGIITDLPIAFAVTLGYLRASAALKNGK